MLGRIFSLLALGALVGGCGQTATVDVRHAKTDKGYLNSRLATLGYLYLWNTETNAIAQLAVIDLTTQASDDHFASLEASQVVGVDIKASLNASLKAGIESEVQSKTQLTLTDAHVVSFRNTFSDLSKEINALVSKGENVRETWYLDEAARPGSPYRYLLVYRAITADSTTIQFDKSVAVGGAITVPTGLGGDVKVKLAGFGSSNFTGDDVTTLVDYYIIKVYYGSDGLGNQTYQFQIDTSIPGGFILSPILRGL